MGQTAKQQLIEIRLGQPLPAFVARHQADGLGYRQIASILRDSYGLSVSYESLRSWCKDEDVAA